MKFKAITDDECVIVSLKQGSNNNVNVLFNNVRVLSFSCDGGCIVTALDENEVNLLSESGVKLSALARGHVGIKVEGVASI